MGVSCGFKAKGVNHAAIPAICSRDFAGDSPDCWVSLVPVCVMAEAPTFKTELLPEDLPERPEIGLHEAASWLCGLALSASMSGVLSSN